MAAASIVNLDNKGNIPADRLSFGPPDWVAIQSATATALSAGPAGATGKQHWLLHAIVSFSAVPAAGSIQVKDGSTVIFQVEFGAQTTEPIDLNFEQRPLRASAGAALTIAVGSAGGAVVQTVSATGFTDIIGTAVTV